MFAVAPERSARRPPRAYTLIDVVITCAIVATMAAIAIPRYGRSIARYRADLAAKRIVADLDLLRMRARAQGTEETVWFYPDQDSCRFVSDPDLNDAAKEYKLHLYEEPYCADIVEASFKDGGETRMMYGNYGHPYWGGYVLIRVGAEQRKIVVDPNTGEATIE